VNPFGPPVLGLPQVRLPYDTGVGHALVGPAGATVFVYFHAETTVAEHAHGPQWGAVLQGTLTLTVAGRSSLLRPGECYFIPAGDPHGAHATAGTALIDVFDDPSRFELAES